MMWRVEDGNNTLCELDYITVEGGERGSESTQLKFHWASPASGGIRTECFDLLGTIDLRRLRDRLDARITEIERERAEFESSAKFIGYCEHGDGKVVPFFRCAFFRWGMCGDANYCEVDQGETGAPTMHKCHCLEKRGEALAIQRGDAE